MKAHERAATKKASLTIRPRLSPETSSVRERERKTGSPGSPRRLGLMDSPNRVHFCVCACVCEDNPPKKRATNYYKQAARDLEISRTKNNERERESLEVATTFSPGAQLTLFFLFFLFHVFRRCPDDWKRRAAARRYSGESSLYSPQGENE